MTKPVQRRIAVRQLFNTVYGRNLVAEVPAVVFRPYAVITMPDLWPRFEEDRKSVV